METLTVLPDEQAQEVLASVRALPIFKSSKKTDWQSLLEGFEGANNPGEAYQPTIITSLGGTDQQPPIAAPFNAIPAMELASALTEFGMTPKITLTSAYKYAVQCNGVDEPGAKANWSDTRQSYQKIIAKFYPRLADAVQFEVLETRGLEQLPTYLSESAARISAGSDSLQATAEKYGSTGKEYLAYMLSHTQAFRDFQAQPTDRFVIKVGAQSEQRFSAWQKAVIEDCLRDAMAEGFVPNRVDQDGGDYGQISLFYPRIGARPPYFSEGDNEPRLSQVRSFASYGGLLGQLEGDVLTRYRGLEKALGFTAITPEDYLEVLR